MKGLDPAVRAKTILPRVYDPEKNERLIRRIRRKGRSYGGCITLDVVGCNMRCSYCYVPGSSLDGRDSKEDNIFGRESKQGKIKPYTPEALVSETVAIMRAEGWKNIQITAGEPFMTAEWILQVVEGFRRPMRDHNKLVWVDTNGFDLVRNPDLFKRLAPLRDYLRLFISSKNAPERYTAMTRVDAKFCDTGFQALELCWEHGLRAFLQGPIAALFSPEHFEWYAERLEKIHPAALLLLDLDRLSYLPLPRIRGGLKQAGLWHKRRRDVVTEKEWQEFLEKKYGRKMKRLISVDFNPKDEKLVQQFVFDGTPISEFPLFYK